MSTITLTRSHAMAPDRLRAEVQSLVDKLVTRFGGQTQWQGDELHYTYGGGVRACVACRADEIKVEVELSGVMSMFRERVALEIEEHLRRHFG